AEQAALLAYRRAVIAAPDSDGAHAARRGIVDLAAASGQSANTSRVALVEAEQDPEDVLAWARELAATDTAEDARAAFDLARALGAPLDERDVQFLDCHPPRWMASDEAYASPLDDATRRALIDDDRDGALGDLLDLLGEVMPLVCPDARRALVDADLLDAVRIPATSGGAATAIYPQIAKALGGPQTLLYTVARPAVPDLAVLLAAPPVIVLGPRLASTRAKSHADPATELAGDTALRFQLGRMVELARPRRLFAAGTDEDSFACLVAGLRHAFGPAPGDQVDARVDREIANEGERLRGALPVQLRRRITERLAAASASELDPVAYIAACRRAADRAGLVACGDVAVALELAGGPDAARHLVQLASTQRYLAARRSMRVRHVEDSTQPFTR
ncbi:MAG: hypothetical protein H0T89_15225, partial [Deltaproteobacteria bacterium]|nr:hypothetical protein [Deltaproteobacteria bacterium]